MVLVVGILFCLFRHGNQSTAGLMKGGARNAKSYLRVLPSAADEIEEHLDDYIEYYSCEYALEEMKDGYE